MLQLLQPQLSTATFAVKEEQRKSETLKFCLPRVVFFLLHFLMGLVTAWDPTVVCNHHKYPGQYHMALHSKSNSVALGLSF